MKWNTALCIALANLLAVTPSMHATTPKQQQGGSTAILMQGWRWDSAAATSPVWYTTMQGLAADMKALGITHVWFPPPADAAPGPQNIAQGYLPRQLNILSSAYGTQAQ